MANSGTYGTGVPVKIDTRMIDIFYSYSENRNNNDTMNAPFKRLPTNVLQEVTREKGDGDIDDVIEGLYNLNLPIQYFSQKGYYTVYIKPKEFSVQIKDVSTLTSASNVRGIVIDSTDSEMDAVIRELAQANNGLVGFRVVYINDDNGKRENYYRIITSNNKCEPVIQTSNNSSMNGYTYRYNEKGSLSFLTLTPSAAPSFKANAAPYIGKVGQNVLFVPTSFEPILLDIEMVDHDADTITTMLEGTQLRDLDNGIITTFNDDNEIYHQSEMYTLKENGIPVYEIRKNKKLSIDRTQTIDGKML